MDSPSEVISAPFRWPACRRARIASRSIAGGSPHVDGQLRLPSPFARGAEGGRDGGVAAVGRGAGVDVVGGGVGAAGLADSEVRCSACQTRSRRKISRSAKSTVLNLASFAEMPADFSTQRLYSASTA